MIDYLADLGFTAAKKRNDDYWYHSPFHHEKTPSFKVNSKLNVWYDHSIGKGGTLLDFATQFHHCTVGAILKKHPDILSMPFNSFATSQQPHRKNRIEITSEQTIRSYRLIQYLKQRNIPFGIADKFCREIHFKLNDKNYYAIGFKNDLGGFEIRNEFFKCSSSPKDITTIFNDSNQVAVFEGFFDFLSFMFLFNNHAAATWNFCVLNSLSFFGKSRVFLERHKQIHLYLDHDNTGRKCSAEALLLNKNYTNESHLYKGYKDLNDWIRTWGKNGKTEIPRSGVAGI